MGHRKYRYTGYGVGEGHVLAISYSGGGQSGVAGYAAAADGSYSRVWAMEGRTARDEAATATRTLQKRCPMPV